MADERKIDRKKNGRRAEFLARWFYRFHGYRILHKNYVTGRGTTAGEVDFIACRGKTLVFVEVKERQNIENAVYAIKARQQQRIVNAAQYFLQSHPRYQGYAVRFDAVFASLPFKIKVVHNAWIS